MASTYTVTASNVHKTKTVGAGLTLEQAQDLKHKLNWDPRYAFLIVTITEEAREEAQEEPAGEPAPAPERKPRRPWDDRDQEERIARARHQAGDYSIRPHDGSFIVEKADGDAYLVDPAGVTCTCPDWEWRCSKVGAACKHITLVGTWLLETGAGLTGAPLYPASPADLARPVRQAVAA